MTAAVTGEGTAAVLRMFGKLEKNSANDHNKDIGFGYACLRGCR